MPRLYGTGLAIPSVKVFSIEDLMMLEALVEVRGPEMGMVQQISATIPAEVDLAFGSRQHTLT